MNWEARGKLIWVRAFLASGNLQVAAAAGDNREPLFSIEPNNRGDHLRAKLEYLRQRHLCFFRDPPPAWQNMDRSPLQNR